MNGNVQIVNGTLYYYGGNGFDNYSVGSQDLDAVLFGYDGLNFLNGGGGDDIILGGRDTDYLNGGDGDDWVFGGKGADHLNGGDGQDTLYGGDGDDVLHGSTGWDKYYGGEGSDTFQASTYMQVGWNIDLESGYASQIIGNPFDFDIINGNSGGLILAAAELTSIENATGSLHDDTIFGSDGDNVLRDNLHSNGNDDDVIHGRGGDDHIFIGGGTDTVFGGAGDDIVEVRAGYDHAMSGGTGRDTFVFTSHVGSPGHIGRIEDFDVYEGDQIQFASYFEYDSNPDDDLRPGDHSYWVEQVGDLATISIDFANDGVADRTIEVVMEHGFTFIPQYDVFV